MMLDVDLDVSTNVSPIVAGGCGASTVVNEVKWMKQDDGIESEICGGKQRVTARWHSHGFGDMGRRVSGRLIVAADG